MHVIPNHADVNPLLMKTCSLVSALKQEVHKRPISLLHGKTDRLHALIIATQRDCVFISEANARIDIWCMALIAWKQPMVELMMSPIMLFLEND